MDDFGSKRYQATTLSAHLLVCHALEDSNSNVCRTSIADIIRMATDVICVIRKDYLQPLTFLDPPSVQPPISLDLSSLQAHTSSDPPSIQLLTSSDLPSVQLPIFLDLPPLQPSTSSDPPSVQIDTSTQLDLLPAIPRVPAKVREKCPKRKRVPVTHRFSPYGGM
ncbi:hypothetical protein AAG906_035228 [Vitis piasezkii]